MEKLMKIRSSSGNETIEVIKENKSYFLKNQNDVIVLRRSEDDEEGVRSIMEVVNNLVDNYNWIEER